MTTPTPLFSESRDVLLAGLRLGKIPSTNSGTGVIDAAMLRARTGLYQRLGPALIESLGAITLTQTPTDTDGYRRLTAAQLEEALVRYDLVDTLGVSFVSGGADLDAEWDSAAPFFKSLRDRRLEELRSSINSEIERMVEFLTTEADAGELTTVKGAAFGAQEWPVDIHNPAVARAPGSNIWSGS